tara:strand:+ start:553 stop:1167 length:615 start_codon:yes stop_codon:yes gene_type:complete
MNLFTYQGVPIRLHSSFFLIALIYTALGTFQGGIIGALLSITLIIMLFGSVLLHEIGHVAVAKHFGINTRSITLHILGGLAAIEKEPEDPTEEIYIALAGPLVNLVLLTLSMPFVFLKVPGFYELALINFVMGIFNLVPAFPMDGGRVLRALLSKKYPRAKATRISFQITKVFAWLFIGGGLYTQWFGLVIVGGFLLLIIHNQK